MDLGLSQGEVGERLGVNAWTVLNWERNKTRPGAKHLGRITEFLGYFPLKSTTGSLSARILETRQRRGLTQVGLAALVGVEESAIRNWERGRRRPRGSRLRMLEECITRASELGSSGP